MWITLDKLIEYLLAAEDYSAALIADANCKDDAARIRDDYKARAEYLMKRLEIKFKKDDEILC
jgi:hypothetical protein